ncbi:hypothetical protein [Actinacidiphila glaucinigra]|uniref:Uncharacterized protein n=1 Tax=Actinacidiphila glaucinigra TaxID=235986 RepID=A0A239JG13_9ACTN|nr:hypothetical protein [Actinacidiphila glaucinigra]SNT04542.1 hypothetical protein SAMN05216252_1135 [Actinacidiphila glaucinigra]
MATALASRRGGTGAVPAATVIFGSPLGRSTHGLHSTTPLSERAINSSPTAFTPGDPFGAGGLPTAAVWGAAGLAGGPLPGCAVLTPAGAPLFHLAEVRVLGALR